MQTPTVPTPAPSSVASSTAIPDGGAEPADDTAAEPRLETESSSLPEIGLVGFGVLFVAAVFVAIGVLRRRARADR